MVTRNFDREIENETVEREDVNFRLFGTQWDCREQVNGKLLMDQAASLDGDSLVDQRDGVIGILKMTVLPDQIDDLLAELDDPDKVIQLQKLVEIVGWLVEQYVDRPTEQPARSPNGPGSRGRTSTAKRTAKASTSRRSTPATT